MESVSPADDEDCWYRRRRTSRREVSVAGARDVRLQREGREKKRMSRMRECETARRER